MTRYPDRKEWKPNARFTISSMPHTNVRFLGEITSETRTMVFKITRAPKTTPRLRVSEFPTGETLYMTPRSQNTPLYVLTVEAFEYGNYPCLDTFVQRDHHRPRSLSRLSGILTCNIVRYI